MPIYRPQLGREEARAAGEAILSGWVTQGPEVAAFEREFAAYVGVRYACAVSSCTTALHLALLAVGVGPGDEVVTVSHSYIATANSVRYCGAVPVFVDIEPGTFNMDPALVERSISRRTKAILCVHQMGMPCDLAAITALARRRRLPVVEDAACAIGSEIRWRGRWQKIGRPHGDIACFSFHPRKLVTTGDGGMLTTRRREYDRRFRLLRQHGMNVSDLARHKGHRVVFERYERLGYNYRMTDIQAAMGRVQLRRLPAMLRQRRRLVRRYCDRLRDIPGLVLPEEPAWARSNWQSFCVRLPGGCDQHHVMQRMLDEGVATRRGIMCAHREPAYRDQPWSCGIPRSRGRSPLHCPPLAQSEEAQDHCVLLPLFPGMTEREQDTVVAVLRRACQACAGAKKSS
ncbi:MAG: DegT/DnrJ/EryC1/StrS family aminotransferase [Kiritimatiellae bacterium]|nr:DegT/DnrJ/EryC1/StrS family aminotransferase [Kiritimatiellia bacterium]